MSKSSLPSEARRWAQKQCIASGENWRKGAFWSAVSPPVIYAAFFVLGVSGY